MARKFTSKIVTANDLLEGDVVYLTADDRWSRRHKDAELLTDEAHATIRLLDAELQTDTIVGAYLANATATDNGPAPVHFRDAFRSRGPSNLPHGKQSEL